MIFDTHAHYDDEQFDADREELLSGMKAGGVGQKNIRFSMDRWGFIRTKWVT